MIEFWIWLRFYAGHQDIIQVCVTLHQAAHLGISKSGFAF